MTDHCFKKTGSNPPTCGVHNVPLVRKELPVEMMAVGYKGFSFLVCPVSGAVFDDEPSGK
jgi:hypothetical protein